MRLGSANVGLVKSLDLSTLSGLLKTACTKRASHCPDAIAVGWPVARLDEPEWVTPNQ